MEVQQGFQVGLGLALEQELELVQPELVQPELGQPELGQPDLVELRLVRCDMDRGCNVGKEKHPADTHLDSSY